MQTPTDLFLEVEPRSANEFYDYLTLNDFDTMPIHKPYNFKIPYYLNNEPVADVIIFRPQFLHMEDLAHTLADTRYERKFLFINEPFTPSDLITVSTLATKHGVVIVHPEFGRINSISPKYRADPSLYYKTRRRSKLVRKEWRITCAKCSIAKLPEEFDLDSRKRSSLKLNSQCKQCRREQNKLRMQRKRAINSEL